MTLKKIKIYDNINNKIKNTKTLQQKEILIIQQINF